MGHRRNQGIDRAEAGIKLAVGIVALIALSIGGMSRFAQVFTGLIQLIFLVVIAGAVAAALIYFSFRIARNRRTAAVTSTSQPASMTAAPSPTLSVDQICERLAEIDWFQFEKFCATLLRQEGYTVDRKGGAQPDGGVDLIVEKDGTRQLIQCKHWRTWLVQEKVVREMLGSMTHFGVDQGAIYTLKGWTEPGAAFAAQHRIALANGVDLARRAIARLSPDEIDHLLDSSIHHCPKCEARMIWRTGNFTPFWGCSRYPRCRGKLNNSGAV